MPFLNQIIDRILDDKNVPLHEVAVVLPNRRARRKLLQGLLAANGQKTMFAPQIFPMEEFVAWLSPLKVVDAVTQLLRLHELTGQFPSDRFKTQQLLSWGTAFLKDISDMDMQLQDVPVILRENALAAEFEIPFGREEISEQDREKIQFNELLADIYLRYKELMQEHLEAYEGMLYRDCAEHIAEYAKKLPFKRVIFAGFYALSPAELQIISYLQDHFHTEIYFDIDPFYCHLEEESQKSDLSQRETSFFIYRNCEKLHLDPKTLDFSEKHYATVPKKVKIVSTSKNMRQIYGAIREVERIKAEKMANGTLPSGDKDFVVDMSDTAVVLADENLLLPFLLSYQPENVTINATMGFPFEATPVSSMLQEVMAIYESAFALTSNEATELTFSGEAVERLWDHEFLRSKKAAQMYFPTVIHYSQLSCKEMLENCPKAEIARRLPDILQCFCNFAETLMTVELYLDLWHEVSRKLKGLQELFATYFSANDEVDFPFAKYSVMKTLQTVSISMQGDPDTGLQVMGLLETRMLDYKNVIMLSVNEGILPKGIAYNSLLPFYFKYKFDGQDALPNYLYQDQVYAYHFFRLLQRAENVTLLYNSASDVNLAERSRFIAQLEYEVVTQHLEEVVEIRHQDLDFALSLPVRTPLSMPKTDKVMELLNDFDFSVSSLQVFVACPLKFCFRYLLHIKEPPALSDHLEAYELGTVIHAVYKKAFDSIKGESDPAKYDEILQWHIEHSDALICVEIQKLTGRNSLSQSDLDQGYWLINRRIIGETVNRYLEKAKSELRGSVWQITANELPVNVDYEVEKADGKETFTVHMTGSIDRVQQYGDTVKILDYKTGRVDSGHLQVALNGEDKDEFKEKSIAPIFTDTKYDKLFQLVVYALLYECDAKQKPTSVEVGIISTREVNMNNPNYTLGGRIFGDNNILAHKKFLQAQLNKLFCRIFDKSKPFTQTKDAEPCKKCDFIRVCGRQTPTESSN